MEILRCKWVQNSKCYLSESTKVLPSTCTWRTKSKSTKMFVNSRSTSSQHFQIKDPQINMHLSTFTRGQIHIPHNSTGTLFWKYFVPGIRFVLFKNIQNFFFHFFFNHLNPMWVTGVPQGLILVCLLFSVIVGKAFAENSRSTSSQRDATQRVVRLSICYFQRRLSTQHRCWGLRD